MQDIMKSKKSLTGKYLRGELKIEVPKIRRPRISDKVIQISGANKNNLKNTSVDFPLGTFTCVTGVSGSGKSTLVIDTLYRLLVETLYHVSKPANLQIQSSSGLEHVDKVIEIDQSPIGKTPRSSNRIWTGEV